MAALREQIEKRVQLGPKSAALIDEGECLPGLDRWTAPEPVFVQDILRWGHVLAATKNLPGAAAIISVVADQILTTSAPKSSP